MRRLWLSVVLLVALIVTACGGGTAEPTAEPQDPTEEAAPAETGGEISVAGSTTVQPLAELFAEAYMADNPDVRIDVQGGGSSVGVKSAAQGTVDVGMASREIKASELEEHPNLNPFAIAFDGIAIAVHPDVPVDELTIEQVHGIFAGEITNWSEVGGPDELMVVVSREEGSGTRAAFEDMVMGEDVIVDTAILQPSNGSVRTTIASTPASIGYLSFGYLDDTTKAAKINGVAPTPANAANGSYPVVRPLNMMTSGEPSDVVQGWLDFIFSAEGQAIVADEGFIPISDEGDESSEGSEESASDAGGDVSGEISVAGSTTVQPLAELFAEAFIAEHPEVRIDVQGGGSSVGVKSAAQGTVDVGMASREVKDSELEEYPNLQPFAIAYDGIAIAVHPDVPVDELTIEQVQDIFAGEITNWSEVGGPDELMVVVSREEGSGTRAAFEDMVMDEALIVDTAILQPSNGSVRTTIASTPFSIGYLSFGYLDDTTKPVKINGTAPTSANAANGSYPIVRPLNMMTDGKPGSVAQEWLDFIMSAEGQTIVADEGYIPLSDEGGEENESGESGDVSGEISVAGSTTVQPLAELFAEAFMADNPDVRIDVQGGGSSVGVKSAAQGTVDVGMASREVKDSELEEYPNLQPFAIAYDGIAIAVHPDVPIDELTIEQVQDIFAGEITNWSEVGGPDELMVVVSREEGSGTRAAFEDMVMDEALIVDTAILQPSNGSVRTTIASTPLSIGYLSFGYLDDTTKALEIDGTAPTAANAANGSYPIVRPLNMMTDGKPGSVAQAWLDFIFSAEGQAIVADEGYIPIE